MCYQHFVLKVDVPKHRLQLYNCIYCSWYHGGLVEHTCYTHLHDLNKVLIHLLYVILPELIGM